MIKVDLGKKLPIEIVEKVKGVMKSVVENGRITDLENFIGSLDPKTDELLSTPLRDQGFTADDFGVSPDSWGEIAGSSPLSIARSNAEIEKRLASKQ
ncbi:MAG TPA: hypothetical protein VN174_03105 [Candidatus Methanoperedens sp.]|nr:hypothetical protein [Candidatus Methanoperedens sp.]